LLIYYLSKAIALLFPILGFQAKKSNAELTEITNKVYFDIEIDGKPAGLW
jgi:peptidylprolyl isomerase